MDEFVWKRLWQGWKIPFLPLKFLAEFSHIHIECSNVEVEFQHFSLRFSSIYYMKSHCCTFSVRVLTSLQLLWSLLRSYGWVNLYMSGRRSVIREQTRYGMTLLGCMRFWFKLCLDWLGTLVEYTVPALPLHLYSLTFSLILSRRGTMVATIQDCFEFSNLMSLLAVLVSSVRGRSWVIAINWAGVRTNALLVLLIGLKWGQIGLDVGYW